MNQEVIASFQPEEVMCFVTKQENGEYNFWDVKVTEDDRVNYYIARAYALEYLEYVKTGSFIDIFQEILHDMPEKRGYVEEIFLSSITEFISESEVSLTTIFCARLKEDWQQ